MYHVFKHGVKPTWEDPANARGGAWIVRLRKGLAARFWEELLLAMVGEQFESGAEVRGRTRRAEGLFAFSLAFGVLFVYYLQNHRVSLLSFGVLSVRAPTDTGHPQVCGAKLSVRFNEDIVSLWTRNADAPDGAVQKLQVQLRRAMRLPQFITMEYKRHEASLNPFLNAQLWRAGDPLPTGQGLGGSPAGGPQGASAHGVPPLAPAVSAVFSAAQPSALGGNARWGNVASAGRGGGSAAGGSAGPAKAWGKEGATGYPPSGPPPARDLNSRWR